MQCKQTMINQLKLFIVTFLDWSGLCEWCPQNTFSLDVVEYVHIEVHADVEAVQNCMECCIYVLYAQYFW